MGNVVIVEANKLLTSSVTGAAYTAATTPVNLALTTGTVGDGTTAGTEVTGGSYARVTTASGWGTASAGSITNTGTFSFTNMPGPITITGIELWDSAGTPIRRWFGALTASKTVNSGDTVTFAASSIVISLT
jgi:hypothetical protein